MGLGMFATWVEHEARGSDKGESLIQETLEALIKGKLNLIRYGVKHLRLHAGTSLLLKLCSSLLFSILSI